MEELPHEPEEEETTRRGRPSLAGRVGRQENDDNAWDDLDCGLKKSSSGVSSETREQDSRGRSQTTVLHRGLAGAGVGGFGGDCNDFLSGGSDSSQDEAQMLCRHKDMERIQGDIANEQRAMDSRAREVMKGFFLE